MKLSSHLNISFFIFFSVGFTHEHFSFLHEKRFIPELYFIFKIVFFELKFEKKAIKRLSWGQEKRKINSFTKKFSWIFFLFFIFFYRKTFFILTWEKVFSWRLFFFFYSVTRKKNIFPPGFINKKYLDSIMKKKDKKSPTKWNKKTSFSKIFSLL